MELELKHLCAYVPYNIKIVELNSIDDPYGGGNIIGFLTHRNLDDIFVKKDRFVPLLLPMRELFNSEYKKSGKNYNWVMGEQIGHIFENNMSISPENVLFFKEIISITEWLLANHFDIYNLIENGLAWNKLTKTL